MIGHEIVIGNLNGHIVAAPDIIWVSEHPMTNVPRRERIVDACPKLGANFSQIWRKVYLVSLIVGYHLPYFFQGFALYIDSPFNSMLST